MCNNPKYSIICVAVATMLIGLWGELFAAAPTIIKMIYALLMYGSFILFPFTYYRNNDFCKVANYLILFLLIDSIILVAMSIYNTDEDMYLHGNKWLTLFLNEYTIFALFPPIYVFIASKAENIALLLKIIIIFILFAILLAPIHTNNIAFLAIFIGVFLPYLKPKYIILFIISFAFSVLTGLGRVRMLMIVNLFLLSALIFVYLFNNRMFRIIFSIIVLTIPFIVFTPILGLAKGEMSFFQTIMQYLAENHYIDDTNDSRTFLYLEIAEDIEKNHTWLLGKGAYCHYYSHYFSFNPGEDPVRLYVEVPFLYMLLRGGIIHIILYYSVFLLAIAKGLIYGKNRFVNIAAILLVGWIFNSFIGDLNGCRLHHLGIFFLVGCCLSPKICSYTDTEIQLIVDEQYEKYRIFKYYILFKILQIRQK